MDTKSEPSALERAKQMLGGNVGIARALNGALTSQAVSQWKEVPVSRVAALAAITGIPSHEFRPDIFEAPSQQFAGGAIRPIDVGQREPAE